MRTMAGFERLAEAGGSRIIVFTDPNGNRLAVVVSLLIHRHGEGPLPPHGRENHPMLALFQTCLYRQIRASEDSDDDLALHDECQGDGVLFGPKKAFRPIDGIDCPEPAAILACRSPVDPAADVFG